MLGVHIFRNWAQIALYQSVLAENGIDAVLLASIAEAEEDEDEDALSEGSSVDDVEIASTGIATAGKLETPFCKKMCLGDGNSMLFFDIPQR